MARPPQTITTPASAAPTTSTARRHPPSATPPPGAPGPADDDATHASTVDETTAGYAVGRAPAGAWARPPPKGTKRKKWKQKCNPPTIPPIKYFGFLNRLSRATGRFQNECN